MPSAATANPVKGNLPWLPDECTARPAPGFPEPDELAPPDGLAPPTGLAPPAGPLDPAKPCTAWPGVDPGDPPPWKPAVPPLPGALPEKLNSPTAPWTP